MLNSGKIPVYFGEEVEKFKRMIWNNKYFLLRYFDDKLQIQGEDAGEIPEDMKKKKGLDNYNRWVRKIPEDSKNKLLTDVRDWAEYEGNITFLQDDSRAFK